MLEFAEKFPSLFPIYLFKSKRRKNVKYADLDKLEKFLSTHSTTFTKFGTGIRSTYITHLSEAVNVCTDPAGPLCQFRMFL